jgi:hypothetical protein
MEDYILSEFCGNPQNIVENSLKIGANLNSNSSYAKLVKVKGPEEVLNRKYFLKI